MKGIGGAWGAISVINATATGIGCSLAIDARTHAKWAWGNDGLQWQSDIDDRLAKAVLARARTSLGTKQGATASCESPFPPARGLKTSSAAATALLRAAWDAKHDSHGLDPRELDVLAVQCAKDAGITITGAYDDQVAVSRGGCHVTDNALRRVVQTIETPTWDVAVWVPEATIAKHRIKHIDPAPIVPDVQGAIRAAQRGDIPAALRDNGRAFYDLYSVAGLPVTATPVHVAYDRGAISAGLSGTGPAVAALFEGRVELPEVPGGAWQWYRSVGVTA